jgi:hypothetical protein
MKNSTSVHIEMMPAGAATEGRREGAGTGRRGAAETERREGEEEIERSEEEETGRKRGRRLLENQKLSHNPPTHN